MQKLVWRKHHMSQHNQIKFTRIVQRRDMLIHNVPLRLQTWLLVECKLSFKGKARAL